MVAPGNTGLFDCDNHIYEPPDAVTRHLPKEFLNRAITPVTLASGGGRELHEWDVTDEQRAEMAAAGEAVRTAAATLPA